MPHPLPPLRTTPPNNPVPSPATHQAPLLPIPLRHHLPAPSRHRLPILLRPLLPQHPLKLLLQNPRQNQLPHPRARQEQPQQRQLLSLPQPRSLEQPLPLPTTVKRPRPYQECQTRPRTTAITAATTIPQQPPPEAVLVNRLAQSPWACSHSYVSSAHYSLACCYFANTSYPVQLHRRAYPLAVLNHGDASVPKVSMVLPMCQVCKPCKPCKRYQAGKMTGIIGPQI